MHPLKNVLCVIGNAFAITSLTLFIPFAILSHTASVDRVSAFFGILYSTCGLYLSLYGLVYLLHQQWKQYLEPYASKKQQEQHV